MFILVRPLSTLGTVVMIVLVKRWGMQASACVQAQRPDIIGDVMRAAEAEVLHIMETNHVDRSEAKHRLERMILWANSYKKFIQGFLDEAQLERERERIKLWSS